MKALFALGVLLIFLGGCIEQLPGSTQEARLQSCLNERHILFLDNGEITANGSEGRDDMLLTEGGWNLKPNTADQRDPLRNEQPNPEYSFYTTGRMGMTPASGNLALYVNSAKLYAQGYHILYQDFDFSLNNTTVEVAFYDFLEPTELGAIIAQVRSESQEASVRAAEGDAYTVEDTVATPIKRAEGWHTIAFSINASGTQVKTYLDGTLVATKTLANPLTTLMLSPKLYAFAYDNIRVYEGEPCGLAEPTTAQPD